MEKKSLELFNQWELYNKIKKNNYMLHSEIFKHVQNVISQHFDTRCKLLDLGCGDASHINQYLSDAHLNYYCGMDLSDTALKLAHQNLKPSKFEYNLHRIDIASSLQEFTNKKFDIVLAGYSLHHLGTDEKKSVIKVCSDMLEYGGLFIIFDLIRDEKNQTREDCIRKYLNNCKRYWTDISDTEMDKIQEHMLAEDNPETCDELCSIFTSNGLREEHVSFLNDGMVALLVFSKSS